MELAKFKTIIESMKAREEWERELYELGVDIFNVPHDPYHWVLELFEEIYPGSAETISYFCWDLDYGAEYTDGCFEDGGHAWNIGSIESLWLYLESRKKI